jgi:uracil-DNA glycosylase family 4
MFTGDRSGEWLFRALHRAGFANRARSVSRTDGLELRNLLVTAAVRCAPPANKPSAEERDLCEEWLSEELSLLEGLRVLVALGGFAYAQTMRVLAGRGISIPRPRPRFGHGVEVPVGDGLTVLCSFHPSQQNTFTGRLTEPMFDAVWERARRLAEG